MTYARRAWRRAKTGKAIFEYKHIDEADETEWLPGQQLRAAMRRHHVSSELDRAVVFLASLLIVHRNDTDVAEGSPFAPAFVVEIGRVVAPVLEVDAMRLVACSLVLAAIESAPPDEGIAGFAVELRLELRELGKRLGPQIVRGYGGDSTDG